jgi:hypothetical protein
MVFTEFRRRTARGCNVFFFIIAVIVVGSSPEERYLERLRINKNKEIAIDLLLLGTRVRPNSE